jgi:hypothetical protein
MLRSISWLQFSIFLLAVLLVYYGYWAWRFELAWIRRVLAVMLDSGSASAGTNVVAPGGLSPAEKEQAVAGEVPAASSAQEAKAGNTSSVAADMDGFRETDLVIKQLKGGLEEAVRSGLDRQGIERGIRKILADHPGLMDTPFEVTVNAFIERTCRASFGWELKGDGLAGLWRARKVQQAPAQPAAPEPD